MKAITPESASPKQSSKILQGTTWQPIQGGETGYWGRSKCTGRKSCICVQAVRPGLQGWKCSE